jgi:hypothetical protein
VNDSIIDTKDGIFETWTGNGSASPTIGDDYWNLYGGAVFSYWKASDATCGYALFLPKYVNGVAHMVNGQTSYEPFGWGLRVPLDPLLASAVFHSEQQITGTFSGSAVYRGYVLDDFLVDWTVKWDLSILGPADEVELIVTSDDYDTWLPEASIQPVQSAAVSAAIHAHDGIVQREGNHLDFRVTLQKKGGGVPAQSVKTFFYTLVNTSNEPGVAMNFPVLSDIGSDMSFDLSFASNDSNSQLSIAENGQHAETAMPGDYMADAFRISSFDFGACGTLQVEALLSDGTRVQAHLQGNASTSIRVPRRRTDSCIGDLWREASAIDLPDDDDSEMNPVGDGHPGDGFTLYEEYRGWIENGRHVRGDPRGKDLFVRVEDKGAGAAVVSALPGISFYQQLTGVNVHYSLRDDEFRTDHVMNANYRGQAHLSEQHGVYILTTATSVPKVVPDIPERQTPGQVQRIELPVSIDPQRKIEDITAYRQKAVAHELLHATAVLHHGAWPPDLDWTIYLPGNKVHDPGSSPRIWDGHGGWVSYVHETPPYLPIVIPDLFKYRSRSGYLDPSSIPYSPAFGNPLSVFSGDQNCVMAYQWANTYQSMADHTRFYYFEYEPFSYDLCTSVAGTVGNAASHVPQSRFFDADAVHLGGDCAHKVCVNDKYKH